MSQASSTFTIKYQHTVDDKYAKIMEIKNALANPAYDSVRFIFENVIYPDMLAIESILGSLMIIFGHQNRDKLVIVIKFTGYETVDNTTRGKCKPFTDAQYETWCLIGPYIAQLDIIALERLRLAEILKQHILPLISFDCRLKIGIHNYCGLINSGYFDADNKDCYIYDIFVDGSQPHQQQSIADMLIPCQNAYVNSVRFQNVKWAPVSDDDIKSLRSIVAEVGQERAAKIEVEPFADKKQRDAIRLVDLESRLPGCLVWDKQHEK